MKKFTAVIAAVAALGIATPSWADMLLPSLSKTIILRGDVMASFDKSYKPDETKLELVIRLGDQVYYCYMWKQILEPFYVSTCFDDKQ